jgi:hypothetical protein
MHDNSSGVVSYQQQQGRAGQVCCMEWVIAVAIAPDSFFSFEREVRTEKTS